MNNPLTYRSFGFNPFYLWRLFYLGVIFLPFPLLMIIESYGNCLLVGGFMSSLAMLYYVITSYTVVSYHNGSLEARSLRNTLRLKKVQNITTWWCYDYGGYRTEIATDMTKANTRAHLNKLNCFVKLESSSNCIYLFEQIHMGDKFPNDHPYLMNQPVDHSKMIKVWDMDNCLKKMGLVKGNQLSSA